MNCSPGHMVGLLLLASAPAFAQSTCMVVPTVPYTIVSPGSYCLDRSHSLQLQSGTAIDIRSSHVTLDLAGHTIENRTNPFNRVDGVGVQGQGNVTVRGGSLVGFMRGVAMDTREDCGTGTAGVYRVEDMTIIGSSHTGIRLAGCAVEARRNRVINTGISPGEYIAVGIAVFADTLNIVDNDVQTVAYNARYINSGIVAFGDHGVVERNRVQDAGGGINMDDDVVYRDNTLIDHRGGANRGGVDGGGNH